MTSETWVGPEGAAAAMSGFQLDALPVLSRSTVDRTEALRDTPDAVAGLWSRGRIVLVDTNHRRAGQALDLEVELLSIQAPDGGPRP